MAALSLSPAGLALVKSLEGFQGEAVRLDDGRWLMGFGHVRSGPPAAPIAPPEAELLLREDLEGVAERIRALSLVQLSQNQFDALVSFAFSIGTPAFERSEVLRRLNAGEPIAAAAAMEAWRVSAIGGAPAVLDALVRRRAVEKALFLDQGAPVGAASALLKPALDRAIAPVAGLGQGEGDDLSNRLRAILAAEPATMAALNPPPSPYEEEPAPTPKRTPAEAARRDVVGYSALGLAGLLLIVMGVTGADDDNGLAYLIFGAPGVVMAAMSLYHLLKKAAA